MFFFRIIDRILLPIRMLGSYLGRLTPGIGRIARLSVPFQVALAVFFFLLIASVIAVVLQSYQEVDSDTWWAKVAWFVVITILAPITLYFAIRLWLAPHKGLYPDIDEAWQQGMEALDDYGLQLDGLPIFLIVGAGDTDQLEAVLNSSGLKFEIGGASSKTAPIRWYATENEIFLCTRSLGVIGQLNGEYEGSPGSRPAPNVKKRDPTRTGEIPVDPLAIEETVPDPVPFTPPVGARGPQKTIDLNDILPNAADYRQSAHESGGKHVSISNEDRRNQRARLQYLCELLRRARDPVCPVNGILMIMPCNAVIETGQQMELAVQEDLEAIRDSIHMRCATILMVTEMHKEAGFMEMIRRIPKEIPALQRFGRGFDERTYPTKERLCALVQHACGAFEDWTYGLFNYEGALGKPTNDLLFALMCKMRGRFRNIFSSTLENGFGCERDDYGPDSLMFGGCYFAATGVDASQQGFVTGVFDKLISLDESVEWTEPAIQLDERRRAIGNLALLVGLAALIVGIVWFWYRDQEPTKTSSASGMPQRICAISDR